MDSSQLEEATKALTERRAREIVRESHGEKLLVYDSKQKRYSAGTVDFRNAQDRGGAFHLILPNNRLERHDYKDITEIYSLNGSSQLL